MSAFNAELAFQEELLTTIADFTAGKAAVAPLECDFFAPHPPAVAPSSLAHYDPFATPTKRPTLTSTSSSASSVPSLTSASSASSIRSLLSPQSLLRTDDLSPTYGCTSPIDPSLFAAMQDAYLGERASTSRVVGGSLPSSPVGMTSLPLPPAPRGIRGHSSKAIRRSSTLSPKPSSAALRSTRPPPLDLTGLSTMPVASAIASAPVQAAWSSRSAPPPSMPVIDDMQNVMWQIDELVARQQQSRPAAEPHFNVAGISLGPNDLDMLAAPASAPAWVSHFPAMPASAPAFDFIDPFLEPHAQLRPMPQPQFGTHYTLASPPHRMPAPYPMPPRSGNPMMPLPHRARSAPILSSAAQRRRASAPSKASKPSFVNFTSKDSAKLLSGVAPSGSSKRKRLEMERLEMEEEDARHEEKRRVVSA